VDCSNERIIFFTVAGSIHYMLNNFSGGARGLGGECLQPKPW